MTFLLKFLPLLGDNIDVKYNKIFFKILNKAIPILGLAMLILPSLKANDDGDLNQLNGQLESTYEEQEKTKIHTSILDDPEVKKVYEKCKKKYDETLDDYADKLEKCMTKDYSPEKLKELAEKYQAGDSDSREDKFNYEINQLSPIKYRNDPAIKKLEAYYEKKLKEALYEDGVWSKKDAKFDPTKRQLVDHSVFMDIYESQLGKSVLSTITYYCIDADADPSGTNHYLLKKDKKESAKIRKINIEKLTDGKTAYTAWEECMISIPHICHGKNNYIYEEGNEPPNYPYSKKRACLVNRKIRDLKQALLAVGEIKEKEKKNTHRGVAFTEQYEGQEYKTKVYDKIGDPDKNESIDDLTSLTSNEMVNTSGYGEALDQQAEEIKKKCMNDSSSDPMCKELLLSGEDREKLIKARDEYIFKSGAVSRILENSKTEDVKGFLIDEGKYNPDDEITKNEQELKDIKEQIKDNYEAEKQAIIQELNEQIKSKSIKKISDTTSTASKIEDIQEEVSNKSQNIQELIHFNNIVTGYLKLKDESDKEVGDNKISIAREMKDSAYDPNNRSPAAEDDQTSSPIDSFSKLEENLRNNGKLTDEEENKDPNEEKGNALLSPSQINKELQNYD